MICYNGFLQVNLTFFKRRVFVLIIDYFKEAKRNQLQLI